MWGFISEYFGAISKGTFQDDPSLAFKFLKSFGLSFGIMIIFTTILQTLIIPLFQVAMYFDLKIRKADFIQESTDQISPANDITNEESPIG